MQASWEGRRSPFVRMPRQSTRPFEARPDRTSAYLPRRRGAAFWSGFFLWSFRWSLRRSLYYR